MWLVVPTLQAPLRTFVLKYRTNDLRKSVSELVIVWTNNSSMKASYNNLQLSSAQLFLNSAYVNYFLRENRKTAFLLYRLSCEYKRKMKFEPSVKTI